MGSFLKQQSKLFTERVPEASSNLSNLSRAEEIERAFAITTKENEEHKILAAGVGELANVITNLAQELNIPIHRDPELASLLTGISPQEALPADAARLVSEVLAFLHSCDRQVEPL